METPTGPAIQLSGLRKRYKDVQAVDGISLSVDRGEIVAFLGRNGAGKSTTIDMMLGLSRPDEGQVRLFGLDPTAACSQGKVGAMLQIGDLPGNMTVGELIRLVSRLYPKSLPLDELVERARLADLIKKKTTDLSGGQRQRVRFGLAIAPDPDFLVLDEPTAAMDVEARRIFWDSLREWAAGGRTVLFATHYLEEADNFADRIVLVRDGKIIADGSTTEIRAMTSGKRLRFTLDEAAASDPGALDNLPDVKSIEKHGRTVVIVSDNSDSTLRAALARFPSAHDIEVSGAGIEEAFLALTGSDDNTTNPQTTSSEEAVR